MDVSASMARVALRSSVIGFEKSRPLLRRITSHYSRKSLFLNRRGPHLIHTATAALPRNAVPFFPNSSSSFPSKLSIPSPGVFPQSAGFHGFLSPPGGKKEYVVWDKYGDADAMGDGGSLEFPGEKRKIFTAVLLGWLGAEHKHLKRYADLYQSRGIKVVTFVVPPWQLFGVHLGRRVEQRIEMFTQKIVSLVSEEEEDGRDSCLLVHTFSNTGWLAYGAILNNLESRVDIIEKIKGCVIDSGPDAGINPRVWAAGFCAAFLKRHSSTASSLSLAKEERLNSDVRDLNTWEMSRPFSETVLLLILEKFFSFVLFLPDVHLF